MADRDDSPLIPETSYSDPFYDRMERFLRALLRRWVLVLAIVIAVAAATVWYRHVTANTPESRSATSHQLALQKLHTGEDMALRDLVQDEEILAEFRARAANDLANHLIARERAAEAEKWARKGLSLAETAGDPQLTAALQLNLAAAFLAQDKFNEARERYQLVEKQRQLAIESLQGELGVAATLIASADAAEAAGQGDRAAQIRRKALAGFERIRDISLPGAETIVAIAAFEAEDLKRRYPSLVEGEAEPSEGEAEPDP